MSDYYSVLPIPLYTIVYYHLIGGVIMSELLKKCWRTKN